MLTVYLATSQPDLVDFMIKVVARKKAESEDAAPGPSRAFAIGSEFESLLPQEMFDGISEESARRALAMEDRNKRIVTTLRGALSRSDHHTEEASLVARGRAQEKPREDRLTVVVRYLVTSKFFLAAVPAIGALTQNKTNQLRVRSGKGANAGLLSELRLLADIQSTGLLEVYCSKEAGPDILILRSKIQIRKCVTGGSTAPGQRSHEFRFDHGRVPRKRTNWINRLGIFRHWRPNCD